jgi:3-hydroxyisobutyrate dehydrogenase
MARIGFIGLGHMGLPMAINLIKAGHEVSGFDLQPTAIDALVEAGGFAARSVKDIACENDIFITMLQTGEQVRDICLGAQGLYKLAAPSLHIDCSTIDVQCSRELFQQAHSQQWLMLDAPVSGGVSGASAATLTFMVGADSQTFEKARPILNAMGKKIYHTGEVGSGQAAKICNNMILGASMIAVCEAFALAEQLGLSAQNLFDVVSNSSGQCWAMSQYVPVPGILANVPANHDFQPGFTVAMMLKDLLLSQEAVSKTPIHTSLAHQATTMYQHFKDAGHGHLDFSAIIKMITQRG